MTLGNCTFLAFSVRVSCTLSMVRRRFGGRRGVWGALGWEGVSGCGPWLEEISRSLEGTSCTGGARVWSLRSSGDSPISLWWALQLPGRPSAPELGSTAGRRALLLTEQERSGGLGPVVAPIEISFR